MKHTSLTFVLKYTGHPQYPQRGAGGLGIWSTGYTSIDIHTKLFAARKKEKSRKPDRATQLANIWIYVVYIAFVCCVKFLVNIGACLSATLENIQYAEPRTRGWGLGGAPSDLDLVGRNG